MFFLQKETFWEITNFFLEISSNLRKALNPPPNFQWYGWAGGREKLRSSPTVSNATEAYKSLRVCWSSASTITRKKQRLWIKLNINNKTATTKATWRFGRTSRSSSGDWWRPNLLNLHNTCRNFNIPEKSVDNTNRKKPLFRQTSLFLLLLLLLLLLFFLSGFKGT